MLSTATKLKHLKNALSAIVVLLAKNKNAGRRTVFGSLLLWFCLYFFHRSFTAHWDACWFTSTRLINNHYEPALLTFIFRALLCHPSSPPRQFTTQKSRVTLEYKTIHWARGGFEKDRSARSRYLEPPLRNSSDRQRLTIQASWTHGA